MDDRPPTPSDAASAAGTRPSRAALGRFFDSHDEAELLAADLFRPDAPLLKGVAPEHVDSLRGYQRLLRVHSDPAVVDALWERGFRSAHQVAALPEHVFVDRYADALGGVAAAADVHRRARGIRARVRLLAAAVRDQTASPHFRATRFHNGTEGTDEYFTTVPSYQDLFGSLDYYECPHCASVLSPAAYFLDLMRIADFYVTLPNATTIPDGWTLEERRPDLFDTLELDCPNTLDVVPVLTLVNGVLEAYLTGALGGDPYVAFAAARFPFNQPYTLPLARIRAALPHLRTTLAQVWADYGAPAGAVARESLQVSEQQYLDLVTPHPTAAALSPFYGWEDITPHLAEIARVEVFLERTGLTHPRLVSLLYQETDSEEFATVAPAFFINDTGEAAGGQPLPPLRIVLDTRDPEDVHEVIENQSLARLDRLMRFIRLQAHLGWSYANLDWAMKSVGAAEIQPAFDALALMEKLRALLKLEPDVLAGLWSPVKTIGRVSAKRPQDLFDRTFNPPVLLNGRDPYATPGVPFDPAHPIDWNPGGTTREDLEVRSRLAAALGVDDNGLSLLAAWQLCLLNGGTPEPGAVLPTSLDNLSALFRLARLAKALGLSVQAYLTLLRVMYGPDRVCVDRPAGAPRLLPADVAAQTEAAAWCRLSGWQPAQLEYVVTGRENASAGPGYTAAQVRPFLDALSTATQGVRLGEGAFVFENVDAQASARIFAQLVDEGFLTDLGIVRDRAADYDALAFLFPVTEATFVPDLSPADSKAAFAGLVEHGIVIAGAGAAAGTLSPTYTPQTPLDFLFVGEADAVHKRDAVHEDLTQIQRDIEHTVEVVRAARKLQSENALGGLAQFLGCEPAMMAVLAPWAAGLTGVTEPLPALLTPLPPGEPVPPELEAMFRLLGRTLYLLGRLRYTPAEAAAAIQMPEAFGWTGTTLDFAGVQSLWGFTALTLAFGDDDGGLIAYFRTQDLAVLASLTRWPPGQLQTLVSTLFPSGTAYATVAGVARLKAAFDRGAATGADVNTLLALTELATTVLVKDGAVDPAAWARFEAAAGAALDLVNARYTGEERDRVNDEITDALATEGRNALLPYTVWSLNARFPALVRTAADLYEYLLIDVQTSNCDRVSPIAQGIASLQLYLQRARLNLEPGVERIPVPAVWWEWLSTYRVWEANRKVFLYPENYVDPSLRRARTPPYTVLQDALLQTEVGKASVADAYGDYMDAFAQAAQLRVAGVYRTDVRDPDSGEATDTLFIFARTASDPYVYYQRRLEHYAVVQDPAGKGRTEGRWSPWEKVDLTIKAEWVTPVFSGGRLMVFWVELAATAAGYIDANQTQQDYTTVRANLLYSFQTFGGEWVQPQSLVEGSIVSFLPDEYLATVLLSPTILNPQQLWWRKVEVVVVPANSWAGGSPPFDNEEQLLVIYGFSFTFLPNQPVPVVEPTRGAFPAQYALNLQIWEAMKTASALSAAGPQPRGVVPMKPAAALSSSLVRLDQQAALLSRPPNVLDYPSPYYGLISGQTLGVQSASSASGTVANEYYGDMVVQNDGTFGGGSTPAVSLLVNLARANTAVTMVKNQPGWFVFDNGDDVFLTASQQFPLLQVSPTLRLSTNLTSLGYPAGPAYVYNQSYAGAPPYPALSSLKFAFTRLGTHTVADLSRRLFAGGIDLLLTPEAQRAPELPFDRFYADPAAPPANVIDTTTDTLDFDGAYGEYFWEVFFYTVFLVAERLNGSGRFEEARRWYEYIFDPMARPAPGEQPSSDDYWRFLPFRGQTPESLAATLGNVAQIDAYNDDPFDPDAIARLRPGAYPRAMAMRYVDNLIDWADALFTQDTRETITQATLLYMLAADLLGRAPVNLGTFRIRDPKTYAEIRAAYDTAGTAQGGTQTTIVLAESAAARDAYYNGLTVQLTGGMGSGQLRTVVAYVGATRTAAVSQPWATVPDATTTYQVLGIPQFLIELEGAALPGGLAPVDVPLLELDPYFCVPENDELVAYWERIADRLFKIRNCMNIRGTVRQLALFEPPLDVRALVRAAAAGSGVPSVEQSTQPPIPFYRFTVVLEQARALTAAVSQLGSAMLAALQAADGEELALLQNTQQKALLALSTRVKEDTVAEAGWQIAALEESRRSAEARLAYYSDLIARGLSAPELANLAAMEAGLVFNVLASATRTAASIGYAVPQVGSPFAMTYGGQQIGNALNAAAGVFEIGSLISSYVAQRTQTMAGYGRRDQEWSLQKTLAELDVAAAGASLEAARLRLQMAQRDLEIHQRQLLQNEEMQKFLQDKFTSRELYHWMAGRLGAIHFQTYSLAFSAALTAQRAYQYEQNTAQTFVNFGYWSAPQRGLLAGEGLMLALNQMEQAYTQGTPRPLEIERTVSLLQTNPLALLALRETGECVFELTERLFDQDFPGHYARKIKTISISIPAVVGPYQNVKATLTQTSNQVVLTPSLDAVRFLLGLAAEEPPPANQLRTNWWSRQAIAVSSGAGDDGMFEMSFNDPRYLPFEGTGAVSTWRLSMPRAANRFSYEAISDVVVRVSYTASDGGVPFRDAVAGLEPVSRWQAGRFLDLAQQYAQPWFTFLRDHADAASQRLEFAIDALAPPQVGDVRTSAVFVQLQVAGGADVSSATPYLTLAAPGKAPVDVPIGERNAALVELETAPGTGTWTLAFQLEKTPAALRGPDGFIDPLVLLDVVTVIYYAGTLDWGIPG